MKISVLISTYGVDEWSALALSRAYPSALAQDAYEVIHEHQPEGTIASSRNAAAAKAAGDWLCFLDADDELASDFDFEIKRARLRIMTVTPDSKYVLYTPAVSYVRNGRRTGARIWREMPLEQANWLVIGTVIHRDLLEAIGGFHEFPHGLEDWNLWGRAWRYGCQIVKVPRAVYIAHRNPDSKHHVLVRQREEYNGWYKRVRADIMAQEPR